MTLPLENLYYHRTIKTTAPSYQTTTASITGGNPFGGGLAPWELGSTLAGALAFACSMILLRKRSVFYFAALTVILIGVTSCANASYPAKGPTGGTPPGTYTVVVGAASPSGGGLSNSATIKLTVQ